MSDKRARMFNTKAGKAKFKADKILAELTVKPGENIADIGSGGGYFTFQFAQRVGISGKVYAVDTDQALLTSVMKQAQMDGLENIIPYHIASGIPQLPTELFDLIFMRNVTHHISNRTAYFQELKKSLRSQGRLAIIEFDGRGSRVSFQRRHRHFIAPDIIQAEMHQTGFKLLQSYDFLSEQMFCIFRKS